MPGRCAAFAAAMIALHARELVLAYHDRSDGGLIATLIEMAFAGHCGLDIALETGGSSVHRGKLFAEEPGAVLQIQCEHEAAVRRLPGRAWPGRLRARDRCSAAQPCACASAQPARRCWMRAWSELRRAWSETSYHMRRLRDEPAVRARRSSPRCCDETDPGLSQQLSFDAEQDIAAPLIATRRAPARGGTARAGRQQSGRDGGGAAIAPASRLTTCTCPICWAARAALAGFAGLVACGGFSYGDVLGAGGGWARSILFHERTRREFARFFARSDTLLARRVQWLPDVRACSRS